jgi:hypothetical protein
MKTSWPWLPIAAGSGKARTSRSTTATLAPTRAATDMAGAKRCYPNAVLWEDFPGEPPSESVHWLPPETNTGLLGGAGGSTREAIDSMRPMDSVILSGSIFQSSISAGSLTDGGLLMMCEINSSARALT